MSPEDVDVETAIKVLNDYITTCDCVFPACDKRAAHSAWLGILSRLRTAEDENAALIEGAANVGMERDMANAENARYREAIESLARGAERAYQSYEDHGGIIALHEPLYVLRRIARAALSVAEPERSE